jgi:ankyrin repeat protein
LALIFSRLTLIEAIKASQISKQWYDVARDRVVRMISDETVLWARQTYFEGHYIGDPADKIRDEITRNPPPFRLGAARNLLGEAISDLRIETVKELLALGFDPNQRDLDDLLPLHSAIIMWEIETEEKFEQCKEMVKVLVLAGFDLNQDSSFTYKLSYAGKPAGDPAEAKYDIFAFCLKLGLNINRKDPETGNTLMRDILDLPYNENAPWIDYLLKLGADPTIRNKKGETPITVAKAENVTAMLKIFRQWKYLA